MSDLKPCSHHRIKFQHDYIGWHAWADALFKAGQRQAQCKKCERWLFPEEVGSSVSESSDDQ